MKERKQPGTNTYNQQMNKTEQDSRNKRVKKLMRDAKKREWEEFAKNQTKTIR